MDLDFEFIEVVLRDNMVLNTLMTYFDGGIFWKFQMKINLHYHFTSDTEWTRVKKACKLEGGSNGELMDDRLIEMNLCISRFIPHFTIVIFWLN